MTIIQAQIVGENAVVPRDDFSRLLELARRSESIDVQVLGETETTTPDIMRLAEAGGAFQFWHDSGEDIYTAQDGEPL